MCMSTLININMQDVECGNISRMHMVKQLESMLRQFSSHLRNTVNSFNIHIHVHYIASLQGVPIIQFDLVMQYMQTGWMVRES